ncbi:MAG: preprotein translocase subunit SecA [Actinobacteria bacterium RBG_16_67_15]|nr:MAG: preprotein translocase subunit SecA [Actinobacteria bacterium RBG_16_67_15]
MALLKRILSAGEGKKLKDLERVVAAVGALEPAIHPLSDEALRAKTVEFRARLADGATLEEIEPEAYAVVREAAQRVLGQRHFDVQVMGAAVLHRHGIAEMKTGEGKTLVSTMPVYLNALQGRGVHVVTVNDYLAKRDAEWMGGVHRFLGLTIGLIQADMQPEERRPAYAADVTYGTNNEFGFDYLRDNMTMEPRFLVQRGHNYAIVDEVDSILVDEARTPLIISGRVGETAKWYRDFSRIADRLHPEVHYEVDEGKRQVITTEAGVTQVEQFLGVENMYDHTNVDLIHHLDVALKAKALYHRDVDYVISNGEIKIVDEFTGRILEGRRYSEGLHQAIEAKEGVRIKEENQTLATITLQNYFRLYEKLAGMTGTAKTEAGEFNEIYKLDVVEIPTNVAVARADQPDLVYMTEDAKFNALTEDLVERHAKGQPVLVGTISIEKSERLSAALRKKGIPHEVLNAKQHEREAAIIAQAGRIGAVTVATNMAGRGVDIRLGGNPDELAKMEMRKQGLTPGTPEYEAALAETHASLKAETAAESSKVVELGGLYVLATERHEARRIDNQLRGRSGRQGDPGESRFYLSLEDDLMRRFATDRVQSIMRRLRIPEDVPIEHGMVTKAIERAQRQVESQNFEIRKNVLKYDEVMNRQRTVIYEWRNRVLTGGDTEELVRDWIDDVVGATVDDVITEAKAPPEWDLAELERRLTLVYPPTLGVPDLLKGASSPGGAAEAVVADAQEAYTRRGELFGADLLRRLERTVVLSIVDAKWREHLADMDYLRSGVGLRAMGQRDPLTEYQREAYDIFAEMVEAIKADSVRYLFHAQMVERQNRPDPVVQLQGTGGAALKRQASSDGKVGRNELCPCGSGKKYKKCHGAAAPSAQLTADS